MKHPDPWLKLVAAARRAPAEEPAALPVGFATRVAAQGLAQRREPGDFLGLWAWRALALALVVMVSSAAVSYPTLAGTNSADDDLDDPVTELVAQL
jgi:hypothetical protein